MRYLMTLEVCVETPDARAADDLANELEEVVVAHLGERHIQHPTERWGSGHSLEGLDPASIESLQALDAY